MTPERIGVILEIRRSDESEPNFVKKLKCRFCDGEFERIYDLRFHAIDAHHGIYVRFVEPHLARTIKKLYGLETIAQEGMKGFRESTYKQADESVDRF